jgi:hypothetical protein
MIEPGVIPEGMTVRLRHPRSGARKTTAVATSAFLWRKKYREIDAMSFQNQVTVGIVFSKQN